MYGFVAQINMMLVVVELRYCSGENKLAAACVNYSAVSSNCFLVTKTSVKKTCGLTNDMRYLLYWKLSQVVSFVGMFELPVLIFYEYASFTVF